MSKKKNIKMLPELLENYFRVYLQKHPDVIADLDSLASYLEVTREELFELEADKKIGRDVRIAKTRIAAIKKQLAYKGKIPPTLLTFDLKCDHGYRDKCEDGGGGVVVFKGKIEEWGN